MSAALRILAASIAALKPKKREEVWEWAERRLILSANVTRDSGPVRLRPYQRGEWSPLWAWLRYAEIDNIAATQTGKTFGMQVTIGYVVDCDPGPGMIVFPTENICRTRSKKHFQPFIRQNFADKLTGRREDLQMNSYTFANGQTILLGHSGSPAQIAGEPQRYLWMDELAKFAPSTDKEPGAEHNARERTKSYRPFSREWSSTTPTLADEPGWRRWKGSTQCQYVVPCPDCGHEQPLYFGTIDRRIIEPDQRDEYRGGIKWDASEELSYEERLKSAYYQCCACDARWNDYRLQRAVHAGRWRARNPNAMRYCSHLNSLVALPMWEVLRKWFESYNDAEGLRLFLNSWLAVPYEEVGAKAEEKTLRQRILPGHRRGMVPAEAKAIFLTADVHDGDLHYRVRAWDENGTSWGIEEGITLPDLLELDAVGRREYLAADGTMRRIDRCLVDCNWRTDEVYQYCLAREGWAYPISGRKIKDPWTLEKRAVVADPLADPPILIGGEVIRIVIDDHRAKDALFTKIQITPGERGAWYLEEGVSDKFIRELQGESRVSRIVKRRPVHEWILVGDNHFLDCEKYQLIAWQVWQVANMAEQPAAAPAAAVKVYNPYTGQEIIITPNQE